MQNLNDSGFSVVTDFVILVPDQESDYVLYDVYNHFKLRGGLLNITRLGTWSEKDGFKIALTEPKIIRRRNFLGIRVKTAGIVRSASSKRVILQALYSGRIANAKNRPPLQFHVHFFFIRASHSVGLVWESERHI